MQKQKRMQAVMMSKRANVFYLEHARITQKDGRIVYLSETGKDIEKFFNIPDKNTAFILLGKGTSITDAAARKLAESNVMVGFCGSGGSPLFSANDITFLATQNEYRPTEYMQKWMTLWIDEEKRIALAKEFLLFRLKWTISAWGKNNIAIDQADIERFKMWVEKGKTATDLLSAEAVFAKTLYKILAQSNGLEFIREGGKKSVDTLADKVNGLLDHGNYIAYGYATVVLHTLGIPFALPVLHGKTRRGALVFDVADLFKDAIIMPLAFKHGIARNEEIKFRNELIDVCHEIGLLDLMMTFVTELVDKKL